MEQRIKGTTKLLALIGSPVGHSGSPAMYNFSFRYHGLDYAYMAFDIKESQVPELLDAVRLLQWRGFNVTMPCKQAVAACVDELSPAARIIGACNTVVNEGGRLIGYMTDGAGFVRNLREHGVEVRNSRIVVLGAGGAATAIQVECALEGAESIAIFNRNLKKAEETAEKIHKEIPQCEVQAFSMENQKALKAYIGDADILINGTSLGMKPHEDTTPVPDIRMFHPELVVADIVYNPLETRMMREAREAGCKKIIGGEGMLLWQGAVAYKLYTGLEMPVEEYQKYKREHV